MLSAQEIPKEAELLPADERAIIADGLLRSLNAPDAETDRKWVEVACRRLEEFRSGRAAAIPGEIVFEKIRERFAQ